MAIADGAATDTVVMLPLQYAKSTLGLLAVTALEVSSKDSSWFDDGDNNYSRRSLRSETNDLRHEESINFRRRNLQSSNGTTCRSSTI
ncbi:hypothetical protein BHYA_0036g00410 [Botrytis hyacinthi]|uniref:Uncharacterized protein n=1 Tax=Botrytis hyacinthi TaxID=278943 RepID=A0A4Z1GVQ4_9HELO|nr:hypothetical protein BHYA_0036g00410 [Botrytis hyacinthi]